MQSEEKGQGGVRLWNNPNGGVSDVFDNVLSMEF